MLAVLHAAADAIAAALAAVPDWGLAGTRPGQHHSDLAADAAAAGRAGRRRVRRPVRGVRCARRERSDVLVVVDPLDGSTNAARGIPWYATSLCAVDEDGPLVALVVNLVNGTRYEAVRGGGALRDGEPIAPVRRHRPRPTR